MWTCAGRAPRCWCGPDRPARRTAPAPRPAGRRARGPRSTVRCGGRARTARPPRGSPPAACRRPSACGSTAPWRSARRDDTTSEPTGAPSPLDRHTETVSNSRPYASSGTPSATCACQIRAPSQCRTGRRRRDRAQRLQRGQRDHPAAAAVVGLLDRDRAGGHREEAVRPDHAGDDVGIEVGADGRPGAGRDAAERRRGADLVRHDVRVRVAEQLLGRRHEQLHRDLVGHRAGRGEQRRLVPEQGRHPLLQRDDGGVLAVDVVADLGRPPWPRASRRSAS